MLFGKMNEEQRGELEKRLQRSDPGLWINPLDTAVWFTDHTDFEQFSIMSGDEVNFLVDKSDTIDNFHDRVLYSINKRLKKRDNGQSMELHIDGRFEPDEKALIEKFGK